MGIKKPAMLVRLEHTADCTRGALVIDGHYICMTLERPWLANQRNVSCIPEGSYTCRRIVSPRFGETFEILDVPGRSHILFHSGNVPADTEGCVLVGTWMMPLSAEIKESRKAKAVMMKLLEGVDEFPLVVI